LERQQLSKYYQATNIKILLTLKEYTELNQQKRKLWLDFTATLHQLSQGITTIEEVMRLEQLAAQFIKDYRETAKSEIKKSKSWNSLDYDEQQKLIRYWGYEKARIENNLLTTAEQLEKQSQEYLKDIELAKFHEQRGKMNCPCYDCESKKEIQAEIKAEREKIIADYEKEQKKQGDYETEWVKGNCYNCGELKKVNSDSGLCKKCSNS
jgi:hypothetical protein